MKPFISTRSFLLLGVLVMATAGCGREEPPDPSQSDEPSVILMNVNPGHFHAGLIHQQTYPHVDTTVYVYAPEGEELNAYLSMVNRFNTRDENPTNWNPVVYTGEDYLERMLEEKPGNVMVTAGNNARKIEYIRQSVENGIHVLADKPMIITPEQFPVLKQTLEAADEQGLVVNDMMTERYEITSILQRELARIPELFGDLRSGTPEEPAIVKESVHYFYKTVAGETLVRPAWFFDVNQQGEAIVDVSTHLVDLILWQGFPGQPVDYRNGEDGVDVIDARVWDTDLTLSRFERITGESRFPDYLLENVKSDSVLGVTANGEFTFEVQDVTARVAVLWGFTNPDGGDTHYSIMRGTQAELLILQDVEQEFVPTLYVRPAPEAAHDDDFEAVVNRTLEQLDDRYPGLSAEESEHGWEIHIPEAFAETHEEHFIRVTERYLDALGSGGLPEWERVNLLTKYYITTKAYELSRE